MCMYSLHARGHDMRKARVGENLTTGEYRQHACFKGDDGKLACIKHETTIAFDRFEFAPGVAQWIRDRYEGKPVTATLIEGNRRSWGRHSAADSIKLMNPTNVREDVTLPIAMIKEGIVGRIPRKVRKDAGTKRPRNLSKVLGLDQIKADIPVDREMVDGD